MIKKSVFAMAMVGCFAVATLFSVNSAEAKNGPSIEGVGTWGSTETVQQTSECTSGKKRKCEGEGSLCKKTLGWDCTQ